MKQKHPTSKVDGISPNLASLESVRNAFKEVREKYGCIDILVNNAGVSERTPFTEYTEENFDWVMDLNVKGVFNATRAASDCMVARGRGVILSTSSMVSICCGVCVAVCGQKAIHLQKDVAGSRELYKNGRIFSTATLKMGRGNSGKLVSEVKRAMNQAAKDCDLAIIDGSPGIGCPVIASINGVDLVLVVAEPSGSGFSDLQRLIQTIESSQAQVAVCVNKWEVSAKHTQMIQQYCMDKGIPFVGKIPFDELAVSAVNEGKTIVDVNGPAKEAIKRMSEAVLTLLDNKNKGEKLL